MPLNTRRSGPGPRGSLVVALLVQVLFGVVFSECDLAVGEVRTKYSTSAWILLAPIAGCRGRVAKEILELAAVATYNGISQFADKCFVTCCQCHLIAMPNGGCWIHSIGTLPGINRITHTKKYFAGLKAVVLKTFAWRRFLFRFADENRR